MSNITVLGTFSAQVLQPNMEITSVSITISIDRIGSPSGLKHSVDVNETLETISPLITCFKDDIIYWKISAPDSSYSPRITSFTKQHGDNVLGLPHPIPADNCSTTAERLGQERFEISFDWLSPTGEAAGEILIQGADGQQVPLTVDPYISCN